MAKINWTCPKCGGHRIDNLIRGQDMSIPVIGVDLDDRHVELDMSDIAWGDSDDVLYVCADCGYVISEGSDEDEFINEVLNASENGSGEEK